MEATSTAISLLLGKQVRVILDYNKFITVPDDTGPFGEKEIVNPEPIQQVITGRLMSFGEGGDFTIMDDCGFLHYCWPMLDIEEI